MDFTGLPIINIFDSNLVKGYTKNPFYRANALQQAAQKIVKILKLTPLSAYPLKLRCLHPVAVQHNFAGAYQCELWQF